MNEITPDMHDLIVEDVIATRPATEEAAVAAAIERGAALVAEVYGPDWYEKIDLDHLALRSTRWCILGQLEGHDSSGGEYTDGVRRIFGTTTTRGTEYRHPQYDKFHVPALFGFDQGPLPYDGEGVSHSALYAELDAAWDAKIARLLEAGHVEM